AGQAGRSKTPDVQASLSGHPEVAVGVVEGDPAAVVRNVRVSEGDLGGGRRGVQTFRAAAVTADRPERTPRSSHSPAYKDKTFATRKPRRFDIVSSSAVHPPRMRQLPSDRRVRHRLQRYPSGRKPTT